MAVSAYLAVIGPSPVCAPGDHATAVAYLAKIQSCLTPDRRRTWSTSELIRLRRLAQKWQDRAMGRDLRFDLVGTEGGRLSQETEWRIYQAKRKRYGHTEQPWIEPASELLTARQRRAISAEGGRARAALWTRQDCQQNGRKGGLRTQAKRREGLEAGPQDASA